MCHVSNSHVSNRTKEITAHSAKFLISIISKNDFNSHHSLSLTTAKTRENTLMQMSINKLVLVWIWIRKWKLSLEIIKPNQGCMELTMPPEGPSGQLSHVKESRVRWLRWGPDTCPHLCPLLDALLLHNNSKLGNNNNNHHHHHPSC